ncbi:hypothetical protein COBT_003794, partial [Conglomerata obtusa]
MHDLKEKAGIDDEVAIQTIIANMADKNKVNYAFHLRNDMNFTALFDLLEIGENNDETPNETLENHKDENEVADMINKLETIALNIGKEYKHKKYANIPIRCRNCNRHGHYDSDCYTRKNDRNTTYYDNRRLYNQTDNTHNKYNPKLDYIEKLLKNKIEGNLTDLEKKINAPTKELKNLFN